MTFTKAIAIISASFLLVGCGGLSEDHKRAAKAHADNLCIISKYEGMDGQGFSQLIANIGDVGVWTDGGVDGQVMKLANQIARERGCVK